MAIKVLKEVNRHPGLAVDPSYESEIIGGQPLVKASSSTIKPYDGTEDTVPYGVAIESTEALAAGDSETHAGAGFDITGYNRGGLISAFMDGGLVSLYDDGRGKPFVDSDTYTLNKKVYANSDGLITSEAGDATAGYNPEVGVVQEVTGSPVTKLVIKLTI